VAAPSAPAVVAGGKTFTYLQLLDHVNRLANYLQRRGVRPGDLVGVCLKRTADMVAAMLAVSRTGAAYVPLDPGYPRDRLAFMLNDTQAKLVLSQRALLDRIPAGSVVNLDLLDAELATCPTTQPEHRGTSDDVAYVIYTSGSTGKPKGVVVRHRAAVNTVDWVNQTFQVGPQDKLLFVTSLAFDLSVYDVFGVLGAGGCLRIADEHEMLDPAALVDILRKEGITMWDSAPAGLQRLAPFFSHGQSSPHLRLVLLSGDWIPVTLPDVTKKAFPKANVIALGGATEASIWSNWYRVEKVDPSWSSIPYGKPIRNARYHVLDPNREPVPVGTAGELYIGGLCLADGYLNRPELTAERFVPDPFRPGERLYRTGDLARYFEDGNLEFLGRVDHQVKVRGYRVELGEIEAALARLPAVREAVVKPFHDEGDGISLAAYVVRRQAIESGAIAQHLREELPGYMVPAAFVFLDALPLTPNGKVDRASLPAPDLKAAARSNYVAPASDAEKALQELWEEVFHVSPICVTARFEDLGGHSLMAAQLASRIETQLGHKVSVESLFTAATIRDQAAVIQQRLELGGGSLVPFNEEGRHAPLFLIAGAGGHVFTFHKFSRLLGPDFPAYGLKAVGVDGSESPLDRVEEIAGRYLEEILKVRPNGPYVLSGYSVGGLMAFELALQMQKRGLEVAKVIAFDTHAPGYPNRLSWPVRMGIHLMNFASLPGEKKWFYLADRFRNLRHKVLTKLRLNHLDLPDPPKVGGLSEKVLKKVWAALERARHAYRPCGRFDGPIILVRSEQHEHWAATRLDDPLKGWSPWTAQPVQVIGVPAAHMEMFAEENLDLLVTQVREVIQAEKTKSGRYPRREKTGHIV
jgi:amino acid adenylation domain-containing protein